VILLRSMTTEILEKAMLEMLRSWAVYMSCCRDVSWHALSGQYSSLGAISL